ncbi:6-phosphogluconate dehydrogenase, decarboxylating, partial [Haematococcus lacustris]
MYIGDGGSGNYVKMVHNGIEYGDMQLISEAYDILKTVGGLSNEELASVFSAWNKSELASFLVEITAIIMAKKDEQVSGSRGQLLGQGRHSTSLHSHISGIALLVTLLLLCSHSHQALHHSHCDPRSYLPYLA